MSRSLARGLLFHVVFFDFFTVVLFDIYTVVFFDTYTVVFFDFYTVVSVIFAAIDLFAVFRTGGLRAELHRGLPCCSYASVPE